jgi:hypothetical protein
MNYVEAVARQMQIEMLYDLHGNSSKSPPQLSNPRLQSTLNQTSPIGLHGSDNSLKEGGAMADLSVSGRGAIPFSSVSTIPNHVNGAESRGLGSSSLRNASILASGDVTSGRPSKPTPSKNQIGIGSDASESEPLWDGSERDVLVRILFPTMHHFDKLVYKYILTGLFNHLE